MLKLGSHEIGEVMASETGEENRRAFTRESPLKRLINGIQKYGGKYGSMKKVLKGGIDQLCEKHRRGQERCRL